jgi:hypothetical protein
MFKTQEFQGFKDIYIITIYETKQGKVIQLALVPFKDSLLLISTHKYGSMSFWLENKKEKQLSYMLI